MGFRLFLALSKIKNVTIFKILQGFASRLRYVVRHYGSVIYFVADLVFLKEYKTCDTNFNSLS